MTGWETDKDEQIALLPLAGYVTFLLNGVSVGLRLEMLPNADAALSGEREMVHLVMTPSQARKLAGVPLPAGAAAEGSPAAGYA